MEVDSVGRILVPDFLKDFATLGTGVVLAGIHNRIEIWDENKWTEYKRKIESQADALQRSLEKLASYNSSTMKHITVLQTEAITGLELREDDVVVDATYGAGGHAKLICAKLGSKGKYIGIDADPTALVNGREDLERSKGPEIHLVHENFANLTTVLSSFTY